MLLATLIVTAAYIEGSVKVELDVEPDGRVTGCTVLESDLPPESNESTCQGMISAARFTPGDKPLPPKITTVIRYRIDREANDVGDVGDASEVARR